MHPDHLVKTIQKEIRKEFGKLRYGRNAALHRFPLLFGILATVGAIATFTGLSRLIAEIDWLNRNPWVLLVFGLLVLLLTGTLYKKLR